MGLTSAEITPDSSIKGQLIPKANCQAVNASKKRINKFVYTTMQCVFVLSLEEIEDTKKPFEKT